MTTTTTTTTARTTTGIARRTTEAALARAGTALGVTARVPADRPTAGTLLACLLALVAVVAPAAAAPLATTGVGPHAAGVGPVPTSGVGADRTAGAGASATATGVVAATDEHNASIRVTNVSADPAEPVAGQEVTFAVTVVNDGDDPVAVTRVEVLDKERAQFQPKRPHASDEDFGRLEPGERRTIRIRGNLTETGLLRLRANVTAETRVSDATYNETVRDSRVFSVDVVELASPGVTVSGEDLHAQVTSTVEVTVTNNADEPMENVEVRLSGEFSVETPSRTVSTIPADSTETVAFNVTADGTGERTASVSAKYDVVGLERRIKPTPTTLTFEEPETATIVLTSAETEVTDGRVHVSGRIANRGEVAAGGVTLSVAEGGGVTGAQPNPKYFVDGGVDVDKSAGFDLYARVEEGVTEIPIEISYKSNGLRETKTVVVTYRGSDDVGGGGAGADSDGGSGGGLAWLLGGLVAVLVLGTMGYAWRNSTGDDSDDGPPVSPDSGGSVLDSGGPGADGGSDRSGSDPAPGSGGPAGTGPGGGAGSPGDGPGTGAGPGAGPTTPGGDRASAAGGRDGHGGPADRAPGPERGTGPDHAADAGRTTNGHRAPGEGRGSPGAGPGGPDSDRPGPAGATGAAGTGGEEVLCDGCGRTFAPAQVGRVAISEGRSATTCQECQERAITAAKSRLGAGESEVSDDVDDLVAAMKEGVTCDGCGEAVLEEDLEEMTLPDGSSAVACSSCRERALAAARRELTGGGD